MAVRFKKKRNKRMLDDDDDDEEQLARPCNGHNPRSRPPYFVAGLNLDCHVRIHQVRRMRQVVCGYGEESNNTWCVVWFFGREDDWSQ